MMPGETHSQTAGIASDATIGTCQNCTALQQNLNEYVAAILAMKQKIIDTDHLLTEYQQKCDELQKVERESSTLHHQLDDLLLKCTPLEEQNKKQIEEIQAMKSELEEKRSSIKIYQQTYLEIESLKEENNKTEAANKKLEAQVKKLEETTTKQSQEIKQLKTEKKTLEKDLKKTHKQLEKTEKRNQQKVLKHAWTQNNSTEETKIDKTKMKLLLEELWMCIEPSAQVSQRKDIQHFSEETGKHRRRPRDLQHSMQTHFPGSPLKDQQHCKNGPFPSSPLKDMQFCKHSPIPIDDLAASTHLHNLAVPEMQHNTKHKSIKHTQMTESSSRERDHFNEGPILNKETGQKYLNEDLFHVSGDEQMAHSPVPGQNLDEILDWLKPLPPLLSPVHFSLPHNQDTLLDNSTNLNEEEEEKVKSNSNELKKLCEGDNPSENPESINKHFSEPSMAQAMDDSANLNEEEEEEKEEKVKSNSNELKKLCEGDNPSENPESINKHFSKPSHAQAMDLPLVGLSNNTSSSALLFHKHPPCMLTEAECDDKAILEQQMRKSNPSFLEESTEMMDVQSDSLQIGDNSDCFNLSVEANENDTSVDNLQNETSQHSTVKVEAVEDCVLNSSASDEGSTGIMKSDSEQLKNIQSLQEPESSGTEYMEVEHVKQEETQKDIEAVKESLINASTDSATLSHHEDIIENNLKSSAPVTSDDQNMLFVDSPTKHCLSRGEKEAQDSSAKDYLTFLATKESEIKESEPLQSNGTTNIETVNEASVGCFQKQEISCTGELSHSTGFTKNEVECATEIEMVSMTETFTVLQKPNLKGNVYAKISDGADSAKENELSHKSSESTEDEAGLTKAPEIETVAVNGSVLQQAHLTGTTCKPNCDETDPATESVSTNYSTGCTEDEMEHLAESEMLTVADTCSGLQKAQLTGTCHKPNTERTDPIKENKSSVDSSACNEYEVECGREAEMIKRTETPFSLLQKSSLTPNAYATNPNGADRIIAEKPTSYSLESTSFTKTDGTTDVKSSIKETSNDIIMMEESLCSKACPVTQEETEDDQDNFTLQRKVKKTKSKGNGSSGLEEKGINLSSCKESVPEVPIDVQASVDNQMSMNDNKALEMSEEGIPNIDTCDALKVKIDSKDLTTEHTSLNKHSDRSTSETTTDENSELEQDEMAYKKKPEENMEICKTSIVVNGAECNVQVTGLDNVLTTGPDSQHGDNASNESLLCESSEIVLSEESENISIKDNDTSNKVSPPVVPKSEIKEETAVSSHRWQHSASVQNTKAKQKEKEPSQTTPPVLATADTSTSIKHSPDSISKVRTEMGPPLRPLLPPLLATPPRFLKCISPPMSTCSRSSFPSPSPMEDLVSPLRETPIPPLMSPLSDGLKHKSPLLATPSPSDITKNRRIQSSPLQFCAATPKHAVPVPGRLPPSAMNAINSSPGIPQENSVRILDTMYPELSARARTLNILKGNIQLTRCASGVGNIVPGPVNQISGFKAINSSTTAFTKTGKACEAENSCFRQVTERLSSMGLPDQVWKRPGVNLHLPKSAKRLRLDNDSPVAERVNLPVASLEDSKSNVIKDELLKDLRGSLEQPVDIKSSEVLKSQSNPTEEAISKAFEKIAKCCFDLMPVIRSHVHVGNISQVPVLRDEEKEVIHEFCVVNKHLAEGLLVAILTKLKTEKKSMKSCYLQALCRVYVGICRLQGDLERARLFSYSILKEDFPESDKLILFVASTWHNVFSLPGLINKAMQAVTRQRAKGEVLTCLSAYLGWEKNPPCDVAKLITGTIFALKTGVCMKFQPHEKRGEDLSPPVWDHIFATELLCSQLQWKWTHDNLICKELWPIMNKWVKQGKGIEQVGITSDVTVAAVLRLIGRLGQLGLKKRYVDSVKNVATVINTFGRHANAEGVPWGVQLATVYAIYDLAPSNPKEAMESLAAWRSETTRTVPPAVTSCITQMGSMCRQIR